MNIHKLKMDTSGNVEDISFVLARKNGDKIGNISNIENVVAKHSFKEASEFTFTSHKKMNNNIFKYWDELKDFKLVWIPEWDMWYETTVEVNEKDDNVKKVSGKTLGEAELSQIMIYGIEINTETDIARDNYKIPTTFYKSDHPEASLMNRLLDEKAPHYKIKHIDKSLMNLQRTFTFDDISLYDAFQEISAELNCLFVFNCGSNENGKPERSISVYDLEANCLDCGYRETFTNKCPKCGSTNIQLGYGEYTNVFISKDNLADEITYSVDADSVKNCFKLEAGDDLMTAAIRACNPNGTDYIYYLPDETRVEMSQDLQEKLKSYDELYEEYQSSHKFNLNSSFVASYNAIIKKYIKYDDTLTEITNPLVGYPKLMQVYFDTIDMVQFLRNKLMPTISKPDNNAKSQCEYLLSNLPSSVATTSLKNLSVSTADNIMVSLAQSIVKGSFKITVVQSTLSNNVWRGKFSLKSYTDDDNSCTSQFVSMSINENYESYVKQRIESILNRADENYYDIVGLFKQDLTVFKSELKKYCLDSLQSFQKCCQSAIDLMVQQGISSNSDSSVYGINTKVLYENIYIPYYNKMNAIQDEILVRENEVYTIEGKYNNQDELVQDGVQTEIERMVGEVQDALNFKKYIGTDLYKEFSSFIRMDKYSNENYVSDGLSNTELMQNAIEFISVATKELFKSATLQHSITGTIKNFLRMKEFEPVTNNFKNGNWICVGIDDQVYQLRIIEYEIDFSDTQNISVTFSDVVSLPDGMSDLESILANSSKMATSYNGVVRQSTINTNFKNKMSEMIRKGLDMTNTKIVSNADNQDITWDEHGLLCREYDDVLSDYTDSQLKIINHGIYITDDNWKTARAGIGNFIYYDPKDKTYKESYGVIADTLVSNLILTSAVGIYNEEKSIEMAKDGIIVTTNTMNKNVFTIRKEITDDEGNVSYERQLYIDDNGNIVLGGSASISWDNIIGTDNVVVKDTLNKFLESIQEQLDGKVETFRQETDPSLEWTDEEKVKHNGDLWYNTKTNLTYIYNGSQWDEFTGDVPDEVWDKIDGKSQIFIKTPIPPYNTGDLWFTESKELFTCIQDRKEGESFNSADWEKKVNYTDDTTANGVKSDLEKLAHVLGYNGTKITGTYIYSPHILGGDLAIGDSSGIHASITTDGKLTATGAEITGVITATSGSFTGAITATSLTLSGCKIDYNTDIENKPDIPTDLTMYIKKDGTIGTLTEEVQDIPTGAKGFKVSSDGLLQASNAIIYGTIYASAGLIGGFNIATTLNDNEHAYANTLYTQATDSNGNTYQAGIKGNSSGNASTEAAFYIRKKASGVSSWANSTIPFYVRKNGYMYCENINIGTNLYLTTQNYYKEEDFQSNRVTVAQATSTGVMVGNITYGNYLRSENDSLLFYIKNNQVMNLDAYKGTYALYPSHTIVDLGAGSDYFRGLYINTVHFNDGTSMSTASKGGTSDYGSLKNKPFINNVELVSGNNTLSDLGIAASGHTHSKLNCSSPIAYKGFGHCHTVLINKDKNMCVAISNDSVPAFTPYNVTSYTNIDNYMIGAGGTCNLGSTSAPWNAVYAKNYYDEYGNKISTGGGSISLKIDGAIYSSGFTNYNLATQNWVTGKGYLTQHQSLSGYATTSWVKGAFGDTLSISGNTLYLKNYNGSQLSSVTLPTSSGGGNNFSKSSIDTLYNQSSSSYSVSIRDNGTAKIFAPNSDSATRLGYTGYKWKTIHCQSSTIDTSDEHLKTNLHSIGSINHIEDVYMHLNPIVYQFKNFDSEDDHDRCHFGFGARETEKIFNDYNINASDYGILCKGQLDKPNKAGDMVEYAFRYGEFVSLNTFMTQKAHHRIDSLTEENQKLKNTILSLQGEIAIIKQKLEELA